MNTTLNKKYIFIMNSTKPTKEEYESLKDIEINNFSRPCLIAAENLGYDVILGVNRKYAEQLRCKEMPNLKFYNSHTYRNIFSIKDNYIAYKNLCDELKEGNVDVIHCNTPIGGFIGRIAGYKYKIRKIIYTAHGFHFFRGASIINNTIFKYIEFILAKMTDIIITINNEDFYNAKRMKLKKGGKVYKVNGVGIDTKKYEANEIRLDELRKELGIIKEDFICIAMGDLIKRKNFKCGIEAISKCKNSKIHYLIAGTGLEMGNLKRYSEELGIEAQIHFLGFRKDIKDLLAVSNCFLFTSLQEGLPRSLMEAMAAGLPCIISDIRGNNDLVKDGVNGFLINNSDDCALRINQLVGDEKLCKKMQINNLKSIKKYDVENVKEQIKEIYEREL